MLSRSQIEQIYAGIQSKGLKYYDLQLEVVDHIASSIETQLESNSNASGSFTLLLDQELNSWGSKKMKKLVKQKRAALKSYWSKRAFQFMLGYFKWPKALLSMILTVSMYFILTQDPLFDLTIRIFTGILIFTSIVAIIYNGYLEYQTSHSYPPPLLVREAYRKTILSVYSGFYLLYFALDKFESLGEQIWDLPILALLMTIYLISIHAFIFVFPRWLEEDTLAQYRHLDLV